ncbi:MAG: hypothetical protein IJ496_04495 [Ruminococcus sp.]|nr:hypothetical protein [Ruminococcus sp.]
MPETNLTVTGDFAKAQSIDFVNQFSGGLTKLMELLGITRRTPMANGSLIKTYKSTTTLADGSVAEGETIPLSKAGSVLAATYELTFQKYRRAVSAEAIQRHGFDQAVTDADRKLLREIQSKIRRQLVAFLGTGTSTASGTGLQAAVANAWGKLQVLFEDDSAGDPIMIVHPMDVSDYIGSASITTQNAFGMQYFKAFTNVSMLTNSNVPQGTFYATVADNLNIAYPTISGGELGKAFSFTTDETGLVGITHTPKTDNLTYETTILTGPTIFAERLDGVVVGTIE